MMSKATFVLMGVLMAVAAGAKAPAYGGRGQAQTATFPPVLDPQVVRDQDDMTWADYKPIPGTNWGDRERVPARALRVALIAIDFEDQPFVITQPKHSDPFGNPQVDPVPRADVAKFYANFWGVPGPLNHGHTIHEYWMEQSRGKIGIPKIDTYGPYRMPRKLYEYGLNEYNQTSGCPKGATCDGRMERDADALWRAEAGAAVDNYEIKLRIYAGYDDNNLYVAVRVRDSVISTDTAEAGSMNQTTWDDDSVEVFVDANNANDARWSAANPGGQATPSAAALFS